ncbi:MAG: hypothetical protein U0271_19050 [Polyangiaceae bacterium]
MSARARIAAVAASAALFVVSCQKLDGTASPPELDRAFFRCRVEPVLVKSCGAFLCHGDTNRYFRVFGSNRLRYGVSPEQRKTPLTAEEIEHNYQSAAAFVDAKDPDKSLLLKKPLDQLAGGYYHGGAMQYGRGDVFLSTEEADYKVLAAWVAGEKEDASCVEPGL